MSHILNDVSRRSFLGASAALGAALPVAAADRSGAVASPEPAVVKKLYLARPSAGWPRPDIDWEAEIRQIDAQLAGLEARYPGCVRFTGGEFLRNEPDTAAWAAAATDADIVLAFNLSTGVYPMLKKLVDADLPVTLFSLPYMGHDWTHAAAFQQMGKKMEVIASSAFSDLEPCLPLFQTVRHLKKSKVLLMSPAARHPKADGYTRQFGTAFAFPDYLELKALYEAEDIPRAEGAARTFTQAALRVVEPSGQEITDSLRLYHAIQKLMAREQANAIAIDCLGGFGRKDLPAYPCVAFSKLNDAGLYGVCECDLESTMTQLLITSFSRVPGFVSDPVFDTSRNEVIHAHCVAATRLAGLERAPSPYLIRSHLEDYKGVAMEVLPPASGVVTVARFADARRMLISTGEVIGNVDDPNGCRTKIRTRVTDARKFLHGYAAARTGDGKMPGTRDLLHRVVFYGDYLRETEALGRLLGFEVIHEV